MHRFRGQRRKACLRAHVDDLADFLPNHQAPYGLGGEKCAFQVDG
jgi:hypothetical protein